MIPPLRIALLPLFVPVLLAAGDWKVADESPALDPSSPVLRESKRISKDGGAPRRIELVWFDSSRHTFRVIDNGGGERPLYPGLAEAMRRNGCVAGCNGGFFHPNREPSGLMIAEGVPSGRFGEGALLSGVLLSSGRGNPYLLRRAEFDPGTYRPTDLIQSGPFLVDRGETVRGLSPERPARRTFVLHDGGRWFALGLSDSLTLAELGEVLASPGFSPARPVRRALNLDGGTSSGICAEAAGLRVEPFKTVRNFIGIVPKAGP